MSEDKNQARNEALANQSLIIGAVTIAWNEACEAVFLLFWLLSGMQKDMAEAIFFSLRSDAAQRDVSRAVCTHTTAIPDEWKQLALEGLQRLDRLAGNRNAAIHTMWDKCIRAYEIVSASQDKPPEPNHRPTGNE